MDKFSELSHAERVAYLASKVALAKSYDSPVLTVPIPDLEILLAELEAKDKRITTVTEGREFWRERVEGAEKEREEFRRRFKLERSCLEDADKRITALDMRNAELNSTIERWATDRAESASRIDELEAKLATPVRLPPLVDWELFGKGSAMANAHNNAIAACSIAIRGAGFKSEATMFKCEGDE